MKNINKLKLISGLVLLIMVITAFISAVFTNSENILLLACVLEIVFLIFIINSY